MSKKNKKIPLKQRNPYKFYRNGYYVCNAGKWTSIVSPFLGIGIAKWDEYFMEDPTNGVKLSIGCTLALVVLGISIYQETKKSETKIISGVVGWAIAFVLCYLLESILADLTLIMGCALLGQLIGLGFEFGKRNRLKYMDEYMKAEIQSTEHGKVLEKIINTKNKGETIPYE